MKSLFVSLISFLFISSSEPLRIELQYNNEVNELQIHVAGKDRLQFAQIYCGEKLLIEFDKDQIPPWDNTIRLTIPCPSRCKFYYVIQTSDGTIHRIKSKQVDLKRNGIFCEVEYQEKN